MFSLGRPRPARVNFNANDYHKREADLGPTIRIIGGRPAISRKWLSPIIVRPGIIDHAKRESSTESFRRNESGTTKRKRKTKNRVTSHCRRKIPIGQTYARARWIFADIISTTDKCAHIKSKQVERSQGRTITTGLYATPNYWNNCHVRDSWTTVIAPCLHFTWSRVCCTLLNQTVRCILLTMIAKHSP